MAEDFHGPATFALHGMTGLPFLFMLAGVASAWYLVLGRPSFESELRARFAPLFRLLDNKYYFDAFNEKVLAAGARALGTAFWKGGDVAIIDGAVVNGSARLVGWSAGVLRYLQSGYLYHYAFATIIGLSALLAWLFWRG